MLRVLIADDHPIFRAGVRMSLEIESELDVVAEAQDGEQAVRLALEHGPDVVVLDLHLPGLNGVEATGQILAARPGTAVLILTMFDEHASVLAAMRAGARGYLLKDAAGEEIVAAVRAVAGGSVVLGPAVARAMVENAGGRGPDPRAFPQLSVREREILDLIAAGLRNAEIAKRLFLSEKTVRNNVSSVFGKLQVEHRAQAILLARRAGLGLDGPGGATAGSGPQP